MKKRFAIVSYFDVNSEKKIRKIQKEIFEKTDSNIALNNWRPHITVGAGIALLPKEENNFFSNMKKVCTNLSNLTVSFSNFEFWDNWTKGESDGYTQYVIVAKSKKSKKLNEIVELIKEKITKDRELYYGELFNNINEYNPHITLAFGDLDKNGFEKIKKEFVEKDFNMEVKIISISILIEENKKWIEYKKFMFGK